VDYLNTRLLHFNVLDEASVVTEIPHGWKPGTSVEPHAHIGLELAAGTPARIQLRAAGMRSADGYTGNTWGNVDTEVVVSGLVQFREVYFSFGLLDMSGFPQESALVGWKITRIAATANEYAGRAVLLSAGCHYEINSMGTHQATPPFTK
jgi:hypothetical protein